MTSDRSVVADPLGVGVATGAYGVSFLPMVFAAAATAALIRLV